MHELSLLVNCYFDDNVVVYLRVNALNSWSSIVDSDQLTPNLLFYAYEVVKLHKIFDKFIVFLARLENIIFYLSWFLYLRDVTYTDIFFRFPAIVIFDGCVAGLTFFFPVQDLGLVLSFSI